MGSAVGGGIPPGIPLVPADYISAAALAGVVFRGGGPFTDTLPGTFYPIVIDAAGNITIYSSPNHLSSLVFHDTANAAATDIIDYENSNTRFIVPNSATSIAMLLAILDRNVLSGANGIEIDPANRRLIFYSNGGGGNTNPLTWDNTTLVTFQGIMASVASAAARAGLNVPHGSAPTSPGNGDVWTTTGGMFVRINGVTKTVTLT